MSKLLYSAVVPQVMVDPGALRFDSSAVDGNAIISGPDLQRLLDVSAMTLWRWRHDKTAQFPAPKRIRGRLYFQLQAVLASPKCKTKLRERLEDEAA